MNFDPNLNITLTTDNNPKTNLDTKNVVNTEEKFTQDDDDELDTILEKIKTQFHNIDNNDVIKIYINDEQENDTNRSDTSSDNFIEYKNSDNDGLELNLDVNTTPPEYIRAASSFMKRKENMWTPELETEIKNFAMACNRQAKKCETKAKRNYYTGRFMQIALIMLGSLSVYSTAANLDSDVKDSISIFTGFSTTVISSIYTLFGFTKRSTMAFETSLGLYGLAMMIKCELLKPARLRKSPFELMLFANMSRDKLIKKIGVDEF